MKLILLIACLLLFAGVGRAQQTVFVPACAGLDDTATLSALISAIGISQGTIKLPYTSANSQRCVVKTLTIPANITLDFSEGIGIKIAPGKTLVIGGPLIAPPKQIFYNAFPGQGRVSFSKNKSLERVFPQWWGAVGDYGADAAPALNAALQAVFSADGGMVFIPAGTYKISSTLLVPTGVGVIGAGKNSTILKASAVIDILTVPSTDVNGNRGGSIGNFTLDGNNLATRGLNLEIAVQRLFYSITSQGSGAGAVLRNAQNNTFLDCDFEDNRTDAVNGAGVRISWGSYNNVFIRCEIAGNWGYEVLFHANATIDPDAVVSAAVPTTNSNAFYKCNFEYPRAAGKTLALVRFRIGSSNTFSECNFSTIGTTTPIDVIKARNDDGAVALNTITNSDVTGEASPSLLTTVLRLEQHNKLRWLSSTVSSALNFAVMDDASRLQTDGQNHIVDVTNMFVPLGRLSEDELIASEFLFAQNFQRRVSIRNNGPDALIVGRTVTPSQTNAIATITYNSGSEQALAIKNEAKGGHTWSIGDGVGTSAGTWGLYDQTESALRLSIESDGKATFANSLTVPKRMLVGRKTYTSVGGRTTTFDLSLGNIIEFTFGAGNETIALTNIVDGQIIVISFIQDAVGGRTPVLPATMKFAEGSAPAWSPGPGKRDIVTFFSNGTNLYEVSRALDVR